MFVTSARFLDGPLPDSFLHNLREHCPGQGMRSVGPGPGGGPQHVSELVNCRAFQHEALHAFPDEALEIRRASPGSRCRESPGGTRSVGA